MKYLIAALLVFVSGFGVQAQTNRTVMVDTNGVVQRPTNFIATNRIVSVGTNGTVANPTNFWIANSNSINSVIGNASTFGGIDLIYRIQQSFFSDLTIEILNGSVGVANSTANLGSAGTNSNAISAIRLIDKVNSEAYQGAGTLFGNDSHTTWIRFEALPRENGIMRFVLGNVFTRSTNIAEYPTNRAIGFELRSLSGSSTNEVRLIAHNGTTNTNGSWVTVSTVFRRQTIGVEQNKTNGQVRLWVGEGATRPTVNTNATINGGPTNNAVGAESALEVGLFTTNTNSSTIGLNVFSSLVEITD